MSTELAHQKDQNIRVIHGGGNSGAVYGLGLIGACVYFIGHATTTEQRVQGFLKGLVWPAYLVYQAFVFLEKK